MKIILELDQNDVEWNVCVLTDSVNELIEQHDNDSVNFVVWARDFGTKLAAALLAKSYTTGTRTTVDYDHGKLIEACDEYDEMCEEMREEDGYGKTD